MAPGMKAAWRLGGLCVLLAGAIGLGRSWSVAWILGQATGAARVFAVWAPPGPRPAARALGDPSSLLSFWLEAGAAPLPPDSEADGPPPAGSAAQVPAPRPSRPGTPLAPVPPEAVRLPAETVLGLAEADVVPRGIARAPTGLLPAGIEILDGAGLGIGWAPGDRLTHVEGVPVAERSLVVARVIELRAAGVPAITGTIFRRTPLGVKSFRLVVEQPYLAPARPPGAHPEPGADPAPSSEGAAPEQAGPEAP